MSNSAPYRQNVNEQPEKLAHFLKKASALHELGQSLELSRRPRIIFSGMGSSHYASYAVWESLTKIGSRAWWLPASELLDVGAGLLEPGTLLCLTSQSGESAEVTEILQQFDLSKVEVLGITNNPESTLAKKSKYLVDLDSGPEATVSTKTYLNTLAAMSLVFSSTTSNYENVSITLNKTVDAISEYLKYLDSFIELTENIFPRKKNYFCVGRGVAGVSAQVAGLILKEATKFAIEGTTAAAFRHGPIELAGPNLSVTFFDHGVAPYQELNKRLAADLSNSGSSVTWIGHSKKEEQLPGPSREGTDPRICDALSFQTLSFALASRTGVQAGDFLYASKITDVL